MKILLLVILLAGTLCAEEDHMTKKQMATLTHFNKLYDSVYTLRSFHGADSLKAEKRLRGLENEIKNWK
jgi:hypothetical protein